TSLEFRRVLFRSYCYSRAQNNANQLRRLSRPPNHALSERNTISRPMKRQETTRSGPRVPPRPRVPLKNKTQPQQSEMWHVFGDGFRLTQHEWGQPAGSDHFHRPTRDRRQLPRDSFDESVDLSRETVQNT